MANGLSARREETVSRIIDGACDVFASQGFAGASVDDIAKIAGVNKATIYYHIGAKEDLYGRVLGRVMADTLERISGNVARAATPGKKLAAYIRGVAETVDGHPPLARVMMRAVASKGENLSPEAATSLAAIFGALAVILEEGRASGAFIDASPLMVYLMILSSLALAKSVLATWEENAAFSEMFKGIAPDMFGRVARGLEADAASEVTRLMLRAVGANQPQTLS